MILLKRLYTISFILFSLLCKGQEKKSFLEWDIGYSNSYYFYELNKKISTDIDLKNKESLIGSVSFSRSLSKKILFDVGFLYYQRKYDMYYTDNIGYKGLYHKMNNHYLNIKTGGNLALLDGENFKLYLGLGILWGTRISNHDLFYNSQTEEWLLNRTEVGEKPIPPNLVINANCSLEGNLMITKNKAIIFKCGGMLVLNADFIGANSPRNIYTPDYYWYADDIWALNFRIGIKHFINKL